MKNLTVIIPSKTFDNLYLCMLCIKQHDPRCRIIVIDDGVEIDKRSSEFKMFVRSNATVIEGLKPFVFARNCNLGITAAGDDDVILMNDDALLETPGGFTMMQQAADMDKQYGIILSSTNVTGQALQQRQPGNSLREIPHGAFVCVLIPRRTIDHIGMLDERYCIDYGVEDRDYCETVRHVGMKVGVHDGCFVDHSKLTSSFRGKPTEGRSFAENWKLFQKKWRTL